MVLVLVPDPEIVHGESSLIRSLVYRCLTFVNVIISNVSILIDIQMQLEMKP